MLALSAGASAQKKKIGYTDDTYGVQKSVVEVDRREYKLSPGLLLQRASKELLIGSGLLIAGGALCGVSAIPDSEEAKTAVLVSGGVLGLAGIVMGIKGVITIGKAGKALDKERPIAFIKPSNKGLGLNLTF